MPAIVLDLSVLIEAMDDNIPDLGIRSRKNRFRERRLPWSPGLRARIGTSFWVCAQDG